MRSVKPLFAALSLLAATMVLAGCGSGGNSGNEKVALVAYSTPQEAYQKLIAAFKATAEGKGVDISQSYGPSGDQSRAIVNGLDADLTHLSFEPDVTRLVENGKVAKDWNDNDTDGIVTDSVVVFATRKGNPKNIKQWSDLTKPGVEVITANPIVSGGARWNLVAAYGQAVQSGASEYEALDYIKSLLANVSVQDKSAREALQTFAQGKGDVLITYENEAITAKDKGQKLDYVIPSTTLLIENPLAVTKTGEPKAGAVDFAEFLKSEEGQKIWAENGYRPVDQKLWSQFGFETPESLLTVDELGGWTKLNKQLFDAEEGAVTKINEELGVSNAK